MLPCFNYKYCHVSCVYKAYCHSTSLLIKCTMHFLKKTEDTLKSDKLYKKTSLPVRNSEQFKDDMHHRWQRLLSLSPGAGQDIERASPPTTVPAVVLPVLVDAALRGRGASSLLARMPRPRPPLGITLLLILLLTWTPTHT